MQPVVVSAADTRSFPLLKGLVLSLKDFEGSRGLPVMVLDLGLTEEERAWLEGERARSVAMSLESLSPGGDSDAKLAAGQRLRTRLPDLVGGYDVYLWMDPNCWVQREGAVPLYLRVAGSGAMAVTPQVHVAYRALYGPQQLKGQYTAYKELYDEKTAEALAPCPLIDSGLFALPAKAPHWKLWAESLEGTLQRKPVPYAAQISLNQMLYTQRREAQALFLPAACNWDCHQALPVLDDVRNLLLEPTPPFPAIGILHLTGVAIGGDVEIRTTNGGKVKRSLRYRTGTY